MLPSMTRAGYPRPFSATLIAASASTAILIPPSVALILYSIVVPGVDLRALFAAGLFPGMLAGAALLVPAWWLARRYRWEAPEDAERPPLGESFRQAIPALFAPVLILGGLRSGLFTPTEAAVVAVTYGVVVGLWLTRELGWRDLWELFGEAAVISGVVMLIIALAGIFAWAGTTLGTFRHLAEWVIGLSDNGTLLLVLIMLAVLVAGMLLDAISIYLILMPILIPVMQHFDWNPVWFGILLAMNIAIGQFTPPVAVNLMVTTEVARVRLEQTVGWAMVFVVAMASAWRWWPSSPASHCGCPRCSAITSSPGSAPGLHSRVSWPVLRSACPLAASCRPGCRATAGATRGWRCRTARSEPAERPGSLVGWPIPWTGRCVPLRRPDSRRRRWTAPERPVARYRTVGPGEGRCGKRRPTGCRRVRRRRRPAPGSG